MTKFFDFFKQKINKKPVQISKLETLPKQENPQNEPKIFIDEKYTDTEYFAYFENGNIKKYAKVNTNGEIEGYLSIFNENGEIIEKINYINGLRKGNPFDYKSTEEIADYFGWELEDENMFKDEIPESVVIIDKKKASTFL